MKIILVSHGDFAAGLCSTLTNFFGASNVYSACVSLENGAETLHTAVREYLTEWGDDEQVVICSDIMGGSANQNAFQYMSRPNTFLVSGMNLSLGLQLMLKDSITIEELRDVISQAKEDMVLMNDQTFAMDEDDE
jgi:mannose/fructose-specific phosphotransferase system component IIA